MNRILEAGSLLKLSGKGFIVKKLIGKGASSVTYLAEYNKTEHILKECNPLGISMHRDENGALAADTKICEEKFFDCLCRFKSGAEKQRLFRLTDNLKNVTSNIQDIYEANGTLYVDMTFFRGETYDHVKEVTLYDLFRRIRAITQVVQRYHELGYLHLDIKPQNIYTIPETPEMVMMFDFDSVVARDDVDSMMFSSYTDLWAASEQKMPKYRKQICAATDLFAIGEIVFYKIFGKHSEEDDRRSFSRYDYVLGLQLLENVNPRVFPLITELFHKTLSCSVKKRYKSAEVLLAQLDEIIKLTDPKESYLKSSLPAVQDFFVGREGEIQEIHRVLNKNRVLFLNGIGGIGKSELAKHYAAEHKEDYDAIIFAPYVSDVNMLLLDDNAIPLYNFAPYPEEKPEEYCARKLKKLRELCDERILFIVDNLDREDDPDLNKLLDLGCKLLITTRMDFSDYGYGTQLYLDAMRSRDSIVTLFHNYYTKPLADEEKACVEQIIDLVAGHTMTVELLAKQMMAGRVRPEKMLAKLQEGGISESGKEKVRSGKDGILTAQSAYTHINMLFNLSKLNEEEQYVLACLALLPYTGVDTEHFCSWCSLDHYETINTLTIGGWIGYDRSKDWIALHPVIQDICSTIWRNTDWENGNNFTGRLLEAYGEIIFNYYYEYVIPYAEIKSIVRCHQPFHAFVTALPDSQYLRAKDYIAEYHQNYVLLNCVLPLRDASSIICGLCRLQFSAEAVIRMLSDQIDGEYLFEQILSLKVRIKAMANETINRGMAIRAKTMYVEGFEETFGHRVFGIAFAYLFLLIEKFDIAEKEMYRSWELRYHKAWTGKIDEMDSMLAHELAERYQYQNELAQAKIYEKLASERFAEEMAEEYEVYEC